MLQGLQRVISNPLMLIFTLFSVVNFVVGVRLGRQGWQNRVRLKQEPLTREAKAWADRSAILLGIPPGVAVHELAHALAIWLFGGQVIEWGFYFYWGYVVPAGTFTPLQDWFISLAGTLGTLLYGLSVWVLTRESERSLTRYLGLRTFRFQLYYALIYYPVFTLLTFVGDWRVIYDFNSTPLASSATLIAHLALLGLFYWADRQGYFEMPALTSARLAEGYAQLRQQLAQQPDDLQARQRAVEILLRSGAQKQAQKEVRTLLQIYPDSGLAHLLYSMILSEGKRQPPVRAIREVEKALELGLDEPGQRAYARGVLGEYQQRLGRTDDALRELDQALAEVEAAESPQKAHLYYLRSRLHRQKRQFAMAEADAERAIAIAERHGHADLANSYRQELETIRQHSQT